jgi:hypothetical protein
MFARPSRPRRSVDGALPPGGRAGERVIARAKALRAGAALSPAPLPRGEGIQRPYLRRSFHHFPITSRNRRRPYFHPRPRCCQVWRNRLGQRILAGQRALKSYIARSFQRKQVFAHTIHQPRSHRLHRPHPRARVHPPTGERAGGRGFAYFGIGAGDEERLGAEHGAMIAARWGTIPAAQFEVFSAQFS